jgi:hypothetical protein
MLFFLHLQVNTDCWLAFAGLGKPRSQPAACTQRQGGRCQATLPMLRCRKHCGHIVRGSEALQEKKKQKLLLMPYRDFPTVRARSFNC